MFKCKIDNRRLVLSMALFFAAARMLAQQAYFQQEVNYQIEATLNDKEHSLSAFERIEYINNSPQAIDYIYFHLWPNAYKNSNTALGKQLLSHGRTALYYSQPSERGYIDSLDFKVAGVSLKMEPDPNNIDICKLILNEPLKPGDKLVITTPFYLKIPDAKFSRLGHEGQAYFMTQWYPKPTVFDNKGWHPMPYLDQGEFFSEFGSFDVRITLPDNYLLAATGDRIDAEAEEEFLNQKVIETLARLDKADYRKTEMAFPPSSARMKTVRFRQYRVHDFAWFADKRYNVIHDQVQTPVSKKTVDTWVFFTNKNFEVWKDAITYVNDATLFYSYLNGDYPYNHVTAVDGTIMAGGGMEYPNITVIGDTENKTELDVVITHEVGHNWFYGILGSNERDYPFLDEGINSFYETRYVRSKYPGKTLASYVNKDSTFNLFGLNKLPRFRDKEFLFNMSMRAGVEQPLDLKSPEFTNFNYGSMVYSKTSVILDYLMDYMGEENFDKAMRFYYEQFRFRHPSPEDFTKTLSYFSGMNLDWFTQHLLRSTDHIDYKLKRVKRNDDGSYTLKVKNKTGVATPINIYGYKDGKAVGLIWYDGFEKNKTLNFPPAQVDYFKLDGLDRMPDYNRRNNYIKTSGLFKKAKPLKLNFITGIEQPRKCQINWLPVAGANRYNGFMLGVAFHNYGFYRNRFEYLLAPMYAFNTGSPVGFAELNYNFYPRSVFQHITVGVKGKSFTYDRVTAKYKNEAFGTSYKDLYLNYYKVAPYIQLELKKKNANGPLRQTITYSNANLFTDSLDVSRLSDSSFSGFHKKNKTSFLNQLSYDLHNNRAIDPFWLHLELQHTASVAKVSASFNYRFSISRKHYFELRAFAGSFIAGKASQKFYYAFRPDGYSGSDDYAFDYNYIGRNEYNGLGYSQFTEKDGNLKVPVLFGNSPTWMAAINLKSPKLFILPVRVFADVVFTDADVLLKDKMLWDAGLNVSLIKDMIEVYVPLAYSEDISKTLDLNNISFSNRIRFTLNIHKLVAKELVKNNFIE